MVPIIGVGRNNGTPSGRNLSLIHILINSFKSKEGAALVNLSLPDEWHIVENYTEMFKEGGLGLAFRNSVLLTVPSVLVIILVSSLAGFVLQRRVSKASKRLLMLILMGLFIPGQIIPCLLYTSRCV